MVEQLFTKKKTYQSLFRSAVKTYNVATIKLHQPNRWLLLSFFFFYVEGSTERTEIDYEWKGFILMTISNVWYKPKLRTNVLNILILFITFTGEPPSMKSNGKSCNSYLSLPWFVSYVYIAPNLSQKNGDLDSKFSINHQRYFQAKLLEYIHKYHDCWFESLSNSRGRAL